MIDVCVRKMLPRSCYLYKTGDRLKGVVGFPGLGNAVAVGEGSFSIECSLLKEFGDVRMKYFDDSTETNLVLRNNNSIFAGALTGIIFRIPYPTTGKGKKTFHF